MKPSDSTTSIDNAEGAPVGARRAALVAAEERAIALFDAIEKEGIVVPGRTEEEIELDIHRIARAHFGIEKYWHKRIVRTGPNGITTARDRPPLRTVEPDDIVYVDLGPIVEAWEADVGRSYAMGPSIEKNRLVNDLKRVFVRVQQHFHEMPDITGAELYAFAQQAARDAGWEFGGIVAGHIVGRFPHPWLVGGKEINFISPNNPTRMRDPDANGEERHWILEIHLVDSARTFGGFYERLM